MLMLTGLLLISIVVTLVGTEYVLDHVVMPLIDDERVQSTGLPAP
ncbi:hypothetical protein ACQR16_00905 [Bradyrhizobium oligotrophicum]